MQKPPSKSGTECSNPEACLTLATWEGRGAIDYGDNSELVALRYTEQQVKGWTEGAGFRVNRCAVEPVDEIPMDALYLEATKG